MKKTLIFTSSLLILSFLAGCTLVDKPIHQPIEQPIDQPTIVEDDTTENENIPPQVMAEKVSKYSWSWKMEKPELVEMNNFNEMLNGVDKEWSRDYEITQDDARRISEYCEKNEVEIYDEYNEWGDLQPIQKIKKNEIVQGNTITVNGRYTADPLAELSEEQTNILRKNGRLIAPTDTLKSYWPNNYDRETAGYPSDGMSEEWIRVYDNIAGDSRENHRYSFNTILVTNDLLLHAYHRLFENSLKYYEETQARNTISVVAYNLAAKFNGLALQETDPELKEIYKFLAAYWTVPAILTPDTQDLKKQGEYGLYEDMDDEELKAFILERANIYADNFEKRHGESEYPQAIINTVTDILNASQYQGLDHLILAFSPDFISDHMIQQNYTLFQPRSHYTDSNGLKTYFMAAKYLMREKFYFGDENLVKAALVMVSQLDKGDLKEIGTLDQLNGLYDMIANLIGTDDDLTVNKLMDWAKKNNLIEPEQIVKNLTKENIDELSKLVPQKIASSQYLVNYTGEVSETEGKSMTDGFIFFGEKFTLDAYLFDLNTAGSTQDEFQTKPNIQTALMVPDILEGNSLANELVKLRLKTKNEAGLVTDRQLASYDDVKADSIKKDTEALKDSKVTDNIYHKRLNALGRLVSKVDENAPYFKQSRAYALKNLVTYLGSYTELKHDTLLYVKQPMMAELGGGGMGDCEIVVEAPALPVPKGYIEADIDLIDELLKLTNDTKKYYDDTAYQNLYNQFDTILGRLKTMVQKEMKNEKISDEDFEWMRHLDGDLYSIVEPIKADYSNPTNKENRGSLIADIFTSEKNNVLYEAIGRPALMYLMVNDTNGARVVVGPVFTHYEFYTVEAPINTPSSTRFTDEDWQAEYDSVVKGDLNYGNSQDSDSQSIAMKQMIEELMKK